MADIIETEKIEVYGVLCINEEHPDGAICNVHNNYQIVPATKAECKAFIKERSKLFPDATYKIFKMKFKEKK